MASWKKVLVSGSSIDVAGITLGGSAITSTAAELNLLDGVSGLVKADFTKLAAVDSTATELNLLDGVTGTLVTEAGTQTLTNKTINASQLSGTIANARLDQQLQDVAGLAVTNGGVIVGDGSNFVLETGATLRTSLGLGTGNNVQHAQITGSTALFSGTVTANAFSGDGSGLTGVSGDFPTTHDVGISHDATKFSVNDGASKFISGSQIKGYVYGGLSGDLTATAAGVVTLANNSVSQAQLDDDAVGANELADDAVVNASVASNAAIAFSKLASLTSARILVGNGSNVATSVAMSGDVTIGNDGATTIANGAVDTAQLAADAVTAAKIEDDAISGEHLDVTAITDQTDLGNAFADADTLLVYDSSGTSLAEGTVKNLANYMQNELTFTTNTDVDVSVSNLKTRLGSNLGDVSIGDTNDNITILGNLTVQGTKTELQTANLNVEDQFILLDSGSGGGTDTGIIFGGSADTANSGYALGWDDSAGVFGISAEIASDATSLGTLSGKLGYIETSTSVPSSAPTRQGVGSIHVKTDDETIWIYS